MNENRTIIRVFLASPGDLADERRAAKEAAEEVNSSTAKPQGYQIDLYGWEDTISAAGRPQAIINEELKQCELFIGILWAKWGTPPDKEGRFTSGFEEEFALAWEGQQNGGLPEMRMYFKDVEEARVKDPGPELSKVLEFKTKLISEKQILFQRFADTGDFARKLRLGLADYVNRKRNERHVNLQDTENSPDIASSQADIPVPHEADALSKDQARFLESLAERLRGETPHESVAARDIARMRLAAMSHYRLGNDDPEMGPHDANLLYRERKEFTFEPSEIFALARFGLGAAGGHNKPLWFWLSFVLQRDPSWLVFQTLSSRANERRGAFAAAQLVGVDLLGPGELLTREQMVSHWLNHDDANAQKDALGYLKDHGNSDDLPIILRKMNDASNLASRELLEAALAITARYDIAAAGELAVRTPFDDIDATLLEQVLHGLSRLQAQDLARALDHRSGKVRERGLREMIERGTAPLELGRRFADDEDLPVRRLALSIIERHEGHVSNDEMRNILVKPKRLGLGLAFGLGATGFDSEGYRAFEHEKFERLSRQPTKYLQTMIDSADVDRDIAYFAMVKRDFSKMAQGLRENFDDRFVAFFAADMARLQRAIGTSTKAMELLTKIKAGEERDRKQHMARALDLLLYRSEIQDLFRIRSAIDDDSTDINRDLFTYLAKYGDWSDIPRLTAIASKPRGPGGNSLLLSVMKTCIDDSAAAIYMIARKRLSELLAFDLSAALLAKILRRATVNEFATLTDEQISSLLLSDSDELRKVIALKVVASLGLRRAKSIFDTHLVGERYFYNVVYWLDLLVAFPHARAKHVAREALLLGRG